MLDFVDDLPLTPAKFVRLIFSCRILWLNGKILESRLLANELVPFFSVDISLQNISSLTASIDENLRQPYILSKKKFYLGHNFFRYIFRVTKIPLCCETGLIFLKLFLAEQLCLAWRTKLNNMIQFAHEIHE